MKTRMGSSKHSEAICVRCAGQESEIFLDSLSGQEVYSPKPANGFCKRPQWTLCFACGLSVLRKSRILETIVALQLTTLEAPKCVVTVQAEFLLVLPSSPWAYVSLHLIGGFLLWPVTNHLNTTPSRKLPSSFVHAVLSKKAASLHGTGGCEKPLFFHLNAMDTSN